MYLTARLEESTVKQLLGELFPVTVVMDEAADDRWIRIESAHHVDFVADEGLRVAVGGQIHWKVAGVPVLLTIHAAQLMLRPKVVDDASGARLVFSPTLEKMDLKNVPAMLDSGIAGIVNTRLGAQAEHLAWHFGTALNTHFPLEKDLVELSTFDLSASGATVTVLSDAIVFTLSLEMKFSRNAAAPTPA